MRLMKRWSVLAACLAMTTASAGTAQQEVVEEEGDEVVREVSDDGAEGDRLLDEEGRVIAERQPDGTVVRYVYDADGVRHVVDE